MVRDPRRAREARAGSGFPFGAFASLAADHRLRTGDDHLPGACPASIGTSQLLTDQPIFLARQLEVTQVQRLSDRLADLYLSLEQPTVFNVSALVGYFLVAPRRDGRAWRSVAVIAFGLAATGVAVLVGPVFIPFFLVPADGLDVLGLAQVAAGWYPTRSSPRRSCSCLHVLTNFLDAFPPPYTIDRLLVGGFPSGLPLVGFVYGFC